jgi:DNA helicase-2/ATP-dependent DNA helicase PcrA
MLYENHPVLHGLNAQQRKAVSLPVGPALILAGPGSGKTRVLTHRVAWLLQEEGVYPWNVLAVTFTNKAAGEMRERLSGMVGEGPAHDMSIGTFHATCARLLRREATAAGLAPDYAIFDSDDQVTVMKMVVKELGLDDKRYRPRALLNAVSRAKNELIPPTEYPIHTYYDEVVARAYVRYQETLRANDALDFDDLLVEPVRLFREEPDVLDKYRARFRHMLVDEFQDTNVAQYVLLHLLAKEHHSLFVVADEDQSIYSWRGADYRNIQRLRQDYPEVREVLLRENYRSTQVILDAAQAVISRNLDRTPKELFTRKEGGRRLVLHEAYDEEAEADFVAREIRDLLREGLKPGDIAVMYRTNAQSRAIEDAFVGANIPYRLIGATRFYARREVKDVLAYLRLAQNPDDDISFLRVVNVPSRRVGARTIEKITERAAQAETSLYQGALILLAEDGLRGRTRRGLQDFVEVVGAWYGAREELSIGSLLQRILIDTGYESHVRDGSDEGEARWENVMALRGVTEEDETLSLVDFLEEVALVADVDELAEEVDAVTLLTLHGAKGLEYPAVFITGLEEGMLPHSRSIDDSPQAVAEERRLLYVGMTRAMARLYLSYAFQRRWYGSSEPSRPSRFLGDLPAEVVGGRRKRRRETQRRSWTTPSWGSATRDSSGGSRRRGERAPVEQRYSAGQKVRHKRFGEGLVQESQVEHGDEIVTVLFFDNSVGVKQLLVEASPLEPVPEH